jgi:hypothetical protein
LGFASSAELWEYINPTVASITPSLDEATLLLYQHILERGAVTTKQTYAFGFQHYTFVEVFNALCTEKWAEAEWDKQVINPTRLRLTELGKRLLKKRLDALHNL